MKSFLTGFVLALSLAACAPEQEPPPAAVDAAAGEAIVVANCSGCHAPDGRGKTSEIPNLAAQPADYLVNAMHAYREGSRHHAALQELITGFSESDIGSIAAYFSGLPPLQTEEAAETAYRQGAETAANCTACHGEHGVSTTAGIPSLAGQQPAYLILATLEYANGSRGHAEKAEMLQGLGEVDIENMAMYFAAQAPEPRAAPPFGDPTAGEPLTAICGSCHGARGVSPDPLVPSLAGQEPVYLVKSIKAYRDEERSHEDMVTNRTDAEVESIAAYYSIQAAGSAVEPGDQAGQVIEKCQRCHGRAAGDSNMVVPVLNSQKKDYLLRVMKQYRDGERGSSVMHKMSSGYSNELLEEIASHYASQPAD
jgi:cytochrome c553